MDFLKRSMRFDLWDEAIASRLQSVRTTLTPIPVSALPKEAGKFGEEQLESIDWLFPSYSASPPDRTDGLQEVEIQLTVRLQFQQRYSDNPAQKAAVEWAESQVIALLAGFRLPETMRAIALESGKLFAPTQGQWYKEINFSFSSRILGIPSTIGILPVQQIGVNNLMEVP